MIAGPRPDPALPDTPPLPAVIGHLAGVLAAAQFPTSERARLRRQDPAQPPGLHFLRFALRHLPPGWERQPRAWMTLVVGLALMGRTAHRPDQPAGRALAQAGYSERHLERLLAAEGTTLYTLLLRAARFLAARQAGCNWVDFARLVLTGRRTKKRQAARLAIARAFYANQEG